MTDEPTLSEWTLFDAPGEVRAAGFLMGQYAKQYRLIVDVIADHQALSLTGVGFDELEQLIRVRLADAPTPALVDDLRLQERLNQLVDWGTCESWQDRAETEVAFLRNRFRYQLTEAGAAINRAVHAIEADVGPTATAALLAPVVLVERLRSALSALAADQIFQASTEFALVETSLEAMSRAALDWQSRLAAALGGAPTEARVTRLLETILAYVEAWGAGVDAYSSRITELLPQLRAIDEDTWRAMTLARLRADTAPDAVALAQQHLAKCVDALDRWFAGENPQATHLRRRMRDAIAPVVRGHRALLAVGGTVSRSAELLRLADAVVSAKSEAEAWRLWATGTGLYSARHLTLEAPEVQVSMSTWQAPPVPISKRLRTQGTRSLSGKAPRVADTSEARRRARQVAARNQAKLAEARQTLMARSGTRLSEWGPLTELEADLFLQLVSDARDRRGTGLSPDGNCAMTLTPIARSQSAVLHTPSGRLVLADALVDFAHDA